MPLPKSWAGRAYGTHTGILFLKLQGQENALSGMFRFTQDGVGRVVYNIHGNFGGSRLTFVGTVASQSPGLLFGDLTAEAWLNASGSLEGEWQTTDGSAGTFVLFPPKLRTSHRSL